MVPPRDPELTRSHILKVSAEEMRTHGYKASSLADILSKAAVSKGALYHHFANKQELGYAVFDEIFIQEFLSVWELPMSSEDPIEALYAWFMGFTEKVTLEELELGCPVCNIATEMSGLDEGFRSKAVAMFESLQTALANKLQEAQDKGLAKSDCDMNEVAAFMMAAVQGSILQGKYGRSLDTFKSSLKCLAQYVDSLRTER